MQSLKQIVIKRTYSNFRISIVRNKFVSKYLGYKWYKDISTSVSTLHEIV